MGTIAYTVPQAGTDLNSVADAEIATALTTIKNWANGGIDAINLSAALAQSLGTNQSGQVTKGAVNIAASESRTNTAYGTLTTPDQVTGLAVPANGIIRVWYQATWQESVSGAARAAIFLGANQLKAVLGAAGDINIQEAGTGGDTTANSLTSCPMGLLSGKSQTHSGDVTTGMAVGVFAGPSGVTTGFIGGTSVTGLPGGACDICKLAAGTYTIGVQFKASSGNVTASNRLLVAQVISPT